VQRTLTLPPPADGPQDYPYPLLALLAALAGQPLDSSFRESPELLALLYATKPQQQQQPVGAVHPAAAAAGGRAGAAAAAKHAQQQRVGRGEEEDSDVDPYACSSDLSDWGEDELGDAAGMADAAASASRLEAAAASASAEGQHTDPHAPHPYEAEQQQQQPRWFGAPTAPIAPAAELCAPRATPHARDLLPMLASARLTATPWLAPDAALCYPQRVLAAAALAALQGDPAEGFALDARSGGLRVDARVTTPLLSPRALHALLREFAEAGSAARTLLHLSRRLCSGPAAGDGSSNGGCGGVAAGMGSSGSGTSAAPFGFPVTPCLRAFGTALAEQLAAQGSQLAALQLQLQQQAAAAAAAAAADDAGALATVRRVASGCIERIYLLRSIVDGAVAEIGGTPAQTSAALIDCLHRRLACGDPASSGPAGEGASGALLHLLLSSLMPLLGALGRWLYGGREGDDCGAFGGDGSGEVGGSSPDDDFFVARAQQLPVQDPRFWSQAFALAGGGGEGGSSGGGGGSSGGASNSCPSFLAPLAAEILSAGKSLRLLRYMQQEELAAAPLQMRILEEAGEADETDDPCGLAWQRGGPVGTPTAAARQLLRRRRGWGDQPTATPGSGSRRPITEPEALPAAEVAAAGDGASSDALLGARRGSVVRMSAAARLQLAVAAAAAQHGEDGEAFQLRFTDDACDLLQQWDAALPCAQVTNGVTGAAVGVDGTRQRSASPPPPLLLLTPGCGGYAWGSGCGSEEAATLQQRQQQQQQDMFQALEAAGGLLRCPGSLLVTNGRAASASHPGAASIPLLIERQPEATGSQQPAASSRTPRPVPPPAAAEDDDTAVHNSSRNRSLATESTDANLPSLSAWGAAMRLDMRAADASLQRLVPWQPYAGAGATPGLFSGGGKAKGQGGWGLPSSSSAADDNDDTHQGLDTASAAAAAGSGGPAEWPSELWPLRPRRRGTGAAATPWLCAPLQPQQRLGWLLDAPPRFVAPVQVLLERTLLEPLKERVRACVRVCVCVRVRACVCV